MLKGTMMMRVGTLQFKHSGFRGGEKPVVKQEQFGVFSAKGFEINAYETTFLSIDFRFPRNLTIR